MKKVFIVIVHYGDAKIIERCVESLFESNVTFEHIVIVNNDLSVKLDNNVFVHKKISVLTNKSNVGFAAGVNQGIESALSQNANYILLLNNDTIVHSDFISNLLHCIQSERKIGIIEPVIQFRYNNKIYYDFGGLIDKKTGRTKHINLLEIKERKLKYVDYVSGCCMLIKARIIKEIGFFDENFFLYYEDVDFCFRAEKAGWKIAVCPDTYIEHVLSSTVGKISSTAFYHQTRSAIIFGKKWIRTPQFYLFAIYQTAVFSFKNPLSGFAAWRAFFNTILS